MAILNSSNIVNNNVIQTNDLLQLYNALNYTTTATPFLAEISGSLLGTASYAITASFALNGGGGGGAVTQIIAGTNVTITSTGPSGTGIVTISSSAGGGGSIFPYTGSTPAIITGSLAITGSNLGPRLIITGSVNATEGFTGSLSGTATNATLATTATTSLTASKVTITNDTSTNQYLPLIFASSSTAEAQPLSFDTDSGAPSYNPSLKSISASSFSGSLLGTASQAANSVLTATATLALSASTVSIANATPYFLTFVPVNNNPAASSQFFTNPSLTATSGLLYSTTLSASIISASSISASSILFGSLLGTSSNALTSSFIRTTASVAATPQPLTFVDSNNAANDPEQLSTSNNQSTFAFTPSTGKLVFGGDPATGKVSASSFTGSLLGVAANATTASHANTASVPLTTTQWTSSSPTPSPFYVPAGRDVGVIWNSTDGSSVQEIFLNTSSAKLGDQVQIFSTVGNLVAPDRGQVQIFCSGSATPNTRVIVAGLTPNPTTHRNIKQFANSSHVQDYFYFHLICVSGSAGATNNTTWQLVEYTAKGSTDPGSVQPWNLLLTTSV
jgi:hypothetical protein